MGDTERPTIQWTYDASAAEPDGTVGSARPNVVEATDGTLLVVGDRVVSAVDAATGRRLWTEPFGKRVAIEGTTTDEVVVSLGSMDLTDDDPVTLVALSLQAGGHVWETTTDITDVAVGERTVVYGVDETVTAVDTTTWNRLWESALDGPVRHFLGHLSEGVVAVLIRGADSGVVTALDTATGTAVWTSSGVEPRGNSWFATAGESVFATTSDYSVVALDASDGTVQWRFEPDRRHPIVQVLSATEDFVVVDTSKTTMEFHRSQEFDLHMPEAVHVVSRKSGRCPTHFEREGMRPTGAAVVDTSLILSKRGPVEAFYLDTKTRRWQFAVSGTVNHATERSLIVTSDGTVYAVSTDSGTVLWTFAGANDSVQTRQTGDRLLVANHDDGEGTIYALEWPAEPSQNNTRVYPE